MRLIAAHSGIATDSGIKEHAEILRSLETRAAFLGDAIHRIRFVYAPKQASCRDLVQYSGTASAGAGNFPTRAALHERIAAFIANFNQTAKVFKWTYTGRHLAA